METKIDLPIHQIKEFCKKWQITTFSLFGSILRDDFHSDSDVDVLVTFAPNAQWSLFDHVDMQDELKSIFGRKVDLLTQEGLNKSRNYIRKQAIFDSARVIYATS